MSISKCVQKYLWVTAQRICKCSKWPCWWFFVGLHVFSHQLTDNHYWDFLFDELPNWKTLAVRAHMWHMHDGALAQFSCAVQDVLSNTSHDWWTDTELTGWPPPSPDLKPPDFNLWEHLKTVVYASPLDNEDILHHHIVDACKPTCNNPSISEQTPQSTMRRDKLCIDIWRTCSYNSQIKCFWIYVDIACVSSWYVKLKPQVCLHPSVTPCIWRPILAI
jgi:hypothetical protein